MFTYGFAYGLTEAAWHGDVTGRRPLLRHKRALIMTSTLFDEAAYDATTGGALDHDLTTGSGEAGLYVGDSQPAKVFVAGNKSWNNQWGLLYRHTRGSDIRYNDFHDNCLGVLMLAGPAPVGDVRFAKHRPAQQQVLPGQPG